MVAVGAKLTASLWGTDVETPLAAWTSWVPAWSATGTAVSIGNGLFVGRYMQDGKSVVAKFTITAGTTTTYGTGNYQFSFPVTPHASFVAEDAMGVCSWRRSARGAGTLVYAGVGIALVAMGGASGGTLSQTTPGSWASGDVICSGTFSYEAA